MPFPKFQRPPEWGISPVGPGERVLSAFDLFVLWASLGAGLLVLVAGAYLVSAGLSLAEAALVAVLGSLLGSLMLAGAARHGARAGVPTMVSLRPVLGRKGSFVPSALNALQLVGWATFELLIMGRAASLLTRDALGPFTAAAFVPIFGVVVWLLAWSGPLAVVRAWLEKFAIWAVFASTAAIAAVLSTKGLDLGARPFPDAYTGAGSWLLGIDLVIVMPISWWPLVSDYNRFARTGRGSATGTSAGFTLANSAFYFLGAGLFVFALQGGGADPIAALGLLGLGFFPLLIILVDETDNAFADIYSTALSVQNLAPRARQLPILTAATAAATAGGLGLVALGDSFSSAYETFLFLIGGIFVPLLGIVIADAFVVRKGRYQADEFAEGSPPFRWQAFAAWAPSTALYLALYDFLYLHPVAGFPQVGATLPSFALAAALHIALAKVTRAAPRDAPPPGESAAA